MLDVNVCEYRPALRESIAHQSKEAQGLEMRGDAVTMIRIKHHRVV
jgi:hypothetical protein